MDREAGRRRAAACFAVARSATIAGERDAAIGRGVAVAIAAGLSLNLFEVPGRKKAQPHQRTADRRACDDMAARFGTSDPAAGTSTPPAPPPGSATPSGRHDDRRG